MMLAEVQLAAHPAGQPGGLLPRGGGQAERGKELAGPPPGPAPGVAEQAAEQDQVLLGGQVGIDGRELPGEADQRPHGGGLADDVVAEHARAAAVGFQQRGEDADGRRLARAVRAEDTVDAAAGDGEVHAVHGVCRAEGLDQPVRLDGQVADNARCCRDHAASLDWAIWTSQMDRPDGQRRPRRPGRS